MKIDTVIITPEQLLQFLETGKLPEPNTVSDQADQCKAIADRFFGAKDQKMIDQISKIIFENIMVTMEVNPSPDNLKLIAEALQNLRSDLAEVYKTGYAIAVSDMMDAVAVSDMMDGPLGAIKAPEPKPTPHVGSVLPSRKE